MTAGWYGKLPATGDFIARRLPAAFRLAWDRWLGASLDAAHEHLGAGWRDDFLSMPAWRFVLSPGLVTSGAWLGVMVPSIDAVGRLFPLTIAASLPPSTHALEVLFASQRWLEDIEAVALAALSPSSNAGVVDAALIARPLSSKVSPATLPAIPHELLRGLEQRLGEPHSAWLAEASEIFGRSLLACEGLPTPGQFCAMLDGRWAEHGWAQGAAQSVSLS